MAIELTIKNSNINIEGKSSQVDLHKELLKGDDGFSPVVEVTETEAGHNVAITDAQGTKDFEVKDGTSKVVMKSREYKNDWVEGVLWQDLYSSGEINFFVAEPLPENSYIIDFALLYREHNSEEVIEYNLQRLCAEYKMSGIATCKAMNGTYFDETFGFYLVYSIGNENSDLWSAIACGDERWCGFKLYYIEAGVDAGEGGAVAVAPSDWNAAEGEPGYIANKPFEGSAKSITWDGKTEGLDTVDLLGMATLYRVSDDYFTFNEDDIKAGKYSITVGEPTADGITPEDSANLKDIWGTSFDDTNTFQVASGDSFAVFPYFASVVEDNTTFTVDCSALGVGMVDVVIEKAGTYFTIMDSMAIAKASYVDVISQIPIEFIPEETFGKVELQDYGTYSVLRIIDRNGKVQSTNIQDGINGATFTPNINYLGELSWTNDRGLANPLPVKVVGPAGEPGYTPVKGKDYYTEADKQEFYDYINTNILGGEW